MIYRGALSRSQLHGENNHIAPLYGYPQIYALTNVDVLAQDFVDRSHNNVFE
jgi:hypothetical protein